MNWQSWKKWLLGPAGKACGQKCSPNLYLAAQWSGVRPSLVFASRLAPLSSRSATMFALPHLAATCRGVMLCCKLETITRWQEGKKLWKRICRVACPPISQRWPTAVNRILAPRHHTENSSSSFASKMFCSCFVVTYLFFS